MILFKKALFIASMFMNVSHAQQSKLTADTAKHESSSLKAFDFRGQGFDVSIDYALLHSRDQFPVIVDVQTRKSDTLIKLTGKAMKELDAQGFKNMALLASDKDTSSAYILESVYIYAKGEVFGVLSRGLSDDGVELWFYHNKDRKIILQEYPKNFDAASYIKNRINEAYRSTGRHISSN